MPDRGSAREPDPALRAISCMASVPPREDGMNRQTSTDAEAIAASLVRPDAFAVVFDRHYDVIARYLRRRLDCAVADELAGETFLRAFNARTRYDTTRGDARAWLFGIATHLVSRHQRSEARRLRAYHRAGARFDNHDAELEQADARVDAEALASVLIDGLSALGARERDVLLLFAWAELSYAEIATALQIPIGTVRSRLHRARGELRDRLGAGPETLAPGKERT
jgi:RNA polymerase sigma factor (sigma-70 family)